MDYFEHEDGRTATHPEEVQNLSMAGYTPCYNPRCDFHISPEALTAAGYDQYDCPRCNSSYFPLGTTPFAPTQAEAFAPPNRFKPGGDTISGLTLRACGQLGEQLVQEQGQIPGYGHITWWSQDYHSPLDGATEEWGIEVKGIDVQAENQRFIAGRKTEKQNKNQMALKMGKKGILGLLVVLDFNRSVADVYGREMLLAGWTNQQGRAMQGIANFRAHNASKLLEELPFKNPFMDPMHPGPQQAPVTQPEDMPF